jgi:hypothetical protein
MTDESFDRKLLGMIAGTLRFHATLTAAQHMFGRSNFSLHSAEKAVVDKAVSAQANYEVTDEVTDSVSLLSPQTSELVSASEE